MALNDLVGNFFGFRSPRRKKFWTRHINTHVRAEDLNFEVMACKGLQKGRGFDVIFNGRVGRHKYKIVTRDEFNNIEEIFWFHVY